MVQTPTGSDRASALERRGSMALWESKRGQPWKANPLYYALWYEFPYTIYTISIPVDGAVHGLPVLLTGKEHEGSSGNPGERQCK